MTTRANWCKHYRGMHRTDSCEAGVLFSSLPGHGVHGFFELCPCFGPEKTGKCVKSEYPTAEEIAAEDAETEKRFQNICEARAMIVEDCGGPFKRGMPSRSNRITCPVCGVTGALNYLRSSYNGHVHAACNTEGCVRWME